MKLKNLPYLLIIILLVIILLQNRNCSGPKTGDVKIDTVIREIPVRDTLIVIKPVPVKSKPDTIWKYRPENKPDTSYQGLLKQYNSLGDKHFESHYYSKTFPIEKYGTVTVEDSVKENALIFQKITSNLLIPERTITKTKIVPYRQLYLGIEVTGNEKLPINGIYGSTVFKTKKDQLYSLGIGYNGDLTFKAGIHWPLHIK